MAETEATIYRWKCGNFLRAPRAGWVVQRWNVDRLGGTFELEMLMEIAEWRLVKQVTIVAPEVLQQQVKMAERVQMKSHPAVANCFARHDPESVGEW